MNALTSLAHLAAPQIELVPLTSIVVSDTAMQSKRRGAYDAAALEELARSIAETGLMHPIVVRPLAPNHVHSGIAKYELIAGERRYLATEKLGQDHILTRIVDLTTEQVLRAQMVENIHRERLDVLAEAQGFKELIDQKVPADAIGDMIGKSRSYVYARTKLLDLAPAVQQALKDNVIDASQALLFARVPTHKLQEHALNQLQKWSYQGHGEKLSFRRTAEIFQEKGKGLLIPLSQVPFSLTDETYHTFGPKRGKLEAQDVIYLTSCAACPKRSGNDPELLAAMGDANVCTDKECHDVKAKQEFERRRKDAEAKGREVLSGEAAAAIMPSQFGTRGFIDLDTECEEDEFSEDEPEQPDGESEESFDARYAEWDERYGKHQPRTYRQILGARVAELEIRLVQDPRHKTRLRELAPDKDVVRLLKEAGLDAKVHRDNVKREKPAKPEDPEAARRRAERDAAEQAKAQLEQNVENGTRVALLKAVHEKWKGPLKRDDLELIVEFFRADAGWPDALELVYPKVPSPATMNERDLGRFLVIWAISSYADGYRNNDRPMKEMAKRLKIDPKAIEKAVRAELTPPEPKGTSKKPVKKSKRK